MTTNEKKVLEYLENHIGYNTTAYWLAKECGILKDDEMDFETDLMIWKVAKENGFRLNNDHCRDEERGMTWVFDFFIEIADVEKDVKRIMEATESQRRMELIEDEYGIFDDFDRLLGFRTTIPWQIKKIYEEALPVADEDEEDEKPIE